MSEQETHTQETDKQETAKEEAVKVVELNAEETGQVVGGARRSELGSDIRRM